MTEWNTLPPLQAHRILLLAVTRDKKYFACVETTAADPKVHQVTVYAFKNSKRVRTISLKDTGMVESSQVCSCSLSCAMDCAAASVSYCSSHAGNAFRILRLTAVDITR